MLSKELRLISILSLISGVATIGLLFAIPSSANSSIIGVYSFYRIMLMVGAISLSSSFLFIEKYWQGLDANSKESLRKRFGKRPWLETGATTILAIIILFSVFVYQSLNADNQHTSYYQRLAPLSLFSIPLGYGLRSILKRFDQQTRIWWQASAGILTGIILFWFLYPIDLHSRLTNGSLLFGLLIWFSILLGVMAWLPKISKWIIENKAPRYSMILVLGAAIIYTSWIYLNATELHSSVANTKYNYSDQHDNMDLAIIGNITNYEFTGNRSAPPLYPYLISFFMILDEDYGVGKLFSQAKSANIWLSLVLLGGYALIFYRNLPMFESLVLTLVGAGGVYVFRAGYFQADLSLYFFQFIFFYLTFKVCQKPTLIGGGLLGVVAALGFLTSFLITPTLIVCLSILILNIAILFFKSTGKEGRTRPFLKRAVIPLFGFAIFFVVIYPYSQETKSIYGSYFYNTTHSILLWVDEKPEHLNNPYDERFIHTHDVAALFTPETMPTPSKYIRSHPPDQLWARFFNGVKIQISNTFQQLGTIHYPVLYTLFFAFLISANIEHFSALVQQHKPAIAYWGIFLAGHFAIYAWYAQMHPGRRFILGLFFPYLFSIFIAIHSIIKAIPAINIRGALISSQKLFIFFNWLVIGLIVIESRVIIGDKLINILYGL